MLKIICGKESDYIIRHLFKKFQRNVFSADMGVSKFSSLKDVLIISMIILTDLIKFVGTVCSNQGEFIYKLVVSEKLWSKFRCNAEWYHGADVEGLVFKQGALPRPIIHNVLVTAQIKFLAGCGHVRGRRCLKYEGAHRSGSLSVGACFYYSRRAPRTRDS